MESFEIIIKNLPDDIKNHILSFHVRKGMVTRHELLSCIAKRMLKRTTRLRHSWITMYAASVRISQESYNLY